MSSLVDKLDEFQRAYSALMTSAKAIASQVEAEAGKWRPSNPEIAVIQETVAAYYNIAPAALVGPLRHAELAKARHVAMYLARKLTKHTVTVIGECFSRDHAMVKWAENAVVNRKEQESQFAVELEDIEKRVVRRMSEDRRIPCRAYQMT